MCAGTPPIVEDDEFSPRCSSTPTRAALLMSIIHLTGDAALLDCPIHPRNDAGDVDGGLTDSERRRCERWGSRSRAYRSGAARPPVRRRRRFAPESFLVGGTCPTSKCRCSSGDGARRRGCARSVVGGSERRTASPSSRRRPGVPPPPPPPHDPVEQRGSVRRAGRTRARRHLVREQLSGMRGTRQ